MRLIITLAILLISVSCSTKKQVSKSVSSQQLNTEISVSKEVVSKDTIAVDSEEFEIHIEAKDSLQPITATLNGITSTFSNAKSVTIRKKRKSLKSSEIKSVKLDSIVHVESKTVSSTVDKSIKRSGWKSILPILLSLLAVYFIGRLIKRYASIWM
jgi:hypothetical protein